MRRAYRLPEEAFCRGNITFSTEHELNRVAFFIKSTVEILPLLTNFDVGLIYSIRRTAHFQMWADSLINLRCVLLNPSPDQTV